MSLVELGEGEDIEGLGTTDGFDMTEGVGKSEGVGV